MNEEISIVSNDLLSRSKDLQNIGDGRMDCHFVFVIRMCTMIFVNTFLVRASPPDE